MEPRPQSGSRVVKHRPLITNTVGNEGNSDYGDDQTRVKRTTSGTTIHRGTARPLSSAGATRKPFHPQVHDEEEVAFPYLPEEVDTETGTAEGDTVVPVVPTHITRSSFQTRPRQSLTPPITAAGSQPRSSRPSGLFNSRPGASIAPRHSALSPLPPLPGQVGLDEGGEEEHDRVSAHLERRVQSLYCICIRPSPCACVCVLLLMSPPIQQSCIT
jgi:hypothetical protein